MLRDTTSLCIYFCGNTRVSDMCFLTILCLIALLREKLMVWWIWYFYWRFNEKQGRKSMKTFATTLNLIYLRLYYMIGRKGWTTISCLLIKKKKNLNVVLNLYFRALLLFSLCPLKKSTDLNIKVGAGFPILEAHLYRFSVSNSVLSWLRQNGFSSTSLYVTQARWAAIAFGTFFRCLSIITCACFLPHVSLCESGLQLCL